MCCADEPQRGEVPEPLDLVVAMPVFNEEQCVASVLRDWQSVLTGLDIRYQIHVYNDGSRDGTAKSLCPFESLSEFRVFHQENRGHGPTILAAYRNAALQAKWVFQVDSDGEIPAENFPQFWRERHNHDLVIGTRQNRGGDVDRQLITASSRWIIRSLFGPGVRDVNCPFRLMRSAVFAALFPMLPEDCFAPNVILSGLAARKRLAIGQLPVPFTQRRTGQVSIAGWKLWRSAVKACIQTCTVALRARGIAAPAAQVPAGQEGTAKASAVHAAQRLPLDTPTRNGPQPGGTWGGSARASYDVLVVGSGLYGSVMAQRLTHAGYRVMLVEKRDHIGGNCATYVDSTTNIPVHQYGTHIFHTNDQRIWDYVRQFADFNDYQHRVLTRFRGQTYTMPINRTTINRFFNLDLRSDEIPGFLASKREAIANPRNFEEKALSMVGRELYEAFILGYTWKQWDRDPRDLPSSIFNRLPIRDNDDDRYFSDTFQGIPKDGYTPLIQEMLRGVDVEVGVDYLKNRGSWDQRASRVIYTGPLDAFFGYRFGRLNWRSVRFEVETLSQRNFQGNSVVNYAEKSVPYTRIHEPKHLHPERVDQSSHTVIMREYSQVDHDAPYYPVGAAADQEILARYRALVASERDIHFGGRLAEYRYYDMHQVIGAALQRAEKIFGVTQTPHLRSRSAA